MFLYELISARRNNPFFINFMLGICLALSFEPFNIPFLSIPVIGFLFLINDHVFYSNHRRVKIFFLNGIFFGFGFFLFSMYWISNSVLVLDERLNYLVPIILFFFPLSMSMFFGFMQIINALVWSSSDSRLFFFSIIWILFEFLRSFLFTGLPWNLIGYSWSWSLSFSQAVSIFGIYGLGLITVFCSVCLFNFFYYNNKNIYLYISVLILLLLFLFGQYRLMSNEVVYSNNKVRIVHTYFDQDMKWSKNGIDQIKQMGSTELLTVFPETSLGLGIDIKKNWLAGYIRKENKNFYNSISLNGNVYDKKILVPFGEFFPFSKYLVHFMPEHQFLQNTLTKGSKNQDFTKKILPLICYEAIFPSFVRKNVDHETELLVNISNDGWFGKFSGPKQHFVHSRYRSIELGLPMIRSSNKGISGIVSPLGEIINSTDTRKNTNLDVKIPYKLNTTIYKKYGNLLTYFLIVLFFIIGYAINLKSRNKI